MFSLLADRFVCRGSAADVFGRASRRSIVALDLATGERVRLRIRAGGDRTKQQEWIDASVHAQVAGALVDYGFIGKGQRFEATALRAGGATPRSVMPPIHVLEWLDSPRACSPRILQVADVPDSREIRVRGFVPVRLSLLSDPSRGAWALLQGRSVALLDSAGEPVALALGVLKLRRAGVRDVCTLSLPAAAPRALVQNAAEGRAAYEVRLLPAGSARPATLMAEAERLLAAGRHAAAERSLRAAVGAFDRRADVFHAAMAELTLGRLLLSRGRASDAVRCFEHAHDRFQRARTPGPAIDAMVYLGIAQTDLSLFAEAERSCRAAYAAAFALKDTEATSAAGVGLARVLVWQEQYAEARDLLESLPPAHEPEVSARYWCMVARLRLIANNFREAGSALGRARPAGGGCDAIESLVRRWEAAVQTRLGDLQALEFHVSAGLAAARAAHRPLHAVNLRLTLIEGLIEAGKTGRARAMAARLGGVPGTSLPPLLKLRVERMLSRSKAGEGGGAAHQTTASAREALADFYSDTTATIQDLDGLRELLSASHRCEDEGEALARAASAVRKHTHALGTGIYGCVGGEMRLLGAAGTSNAALARRSCGAGMSIGPEKTPGGAEGAVPMRYLGRLIGALATRWSVDGPQHAERAMAFSAAAAAACAPLVYVLLERQCAPAQANTGFDLIGVSGAMEDVRKAIGRAANAPFTVLIEGESGSGKELVARAIHRAGCRRERRFCAFNCAAMPEDLVDAELFGHARGAFTGATCERLGLFESADGGTVFLDEVGELSARAQAKVLRSLQEGEVRRIGENFTRSFDARLIAATNRPLRAEVEAGRFRQDLLYRLDVIRIVVPPLRDRAEDIPMLARRFWSAAAERVGSKAVLGQSVLSALARYDWPGNVRELQNVLTALVVAAPSRGVIGASDLPAAVARATQMDSHESLESARFKFEQRFVRAALARAAGHRGQTASALGVSRQGLAKLLQRLRLDS